MAMTVNSLQQNSTLDGNECTYNDNESHTPLPKKIPKNGNRAKKKKIEYRYCCLTTTKRRVQQKIPVIY